MNPRLAYIVARIASIRMNLYYGLISRPVCNDCGGMASVFHVEHQIAIKGPRWIGLPVAVLHAMFTNMPTVRCRLCAWLNERNLNA